MIPHMLQTVSYIPDSKVGVAHKQSWPTARLDHMTRLCLAQRLLGSDKLYQSVCLK